MVPRFLWPLLINRPWCAGTYRRPPTRPVQRSDLRETAVPECAQSKRKAQSPHSALDVDGRGTIAARLRRVGRVPGAWHHALKREA